MKIYFSTIVLVFSCQAWASLGENSDTVSSDCVKLNGTLTNPSTNHYLCQTKAAQITFVTNSTGTVTNIGWSGRRTPNLSTLLGSYFAEYRAAFRQPHHQSAHLRKAVHETSHIKVIRFGNARFHSGEMSLK